MLLAGLGGSCPEAREAGARDGKRPGEHSTQATGLCVCVCGGGDMWEGGLGESECCGKDMWKGQYLKV